MKLWLTFLTCSISTVRRSAVSILWIPLSLFTSWAWKISRDKLSVTWPIFRALYFSEALKCYSFTYRLEMMIKYAFTSASVRVDTQSSKLMCACDLTLVKVCYLQCYPCRRLEVQSSLSEELAQSWRVSMLVCKYIVSMLACKYLLY